MFNETYCESFGADCFNEGDCNNCEYSEKEESIKFDNQLSVKELKQLNELTMLNPTLSQEEYKEIISTYQKAINRLVQSNIEII